MTKCTRCKADSETALCPACQAAPLTTIETPHAMPQPAAGVTIEPFGDGPCWIVRDASGAESLLTADRTSAELRAERLRIMGGRWKTAEQLCDMIMEQQRREAPTPHARLDAALLASLGLTDAAAGIVTKELTKLREELRAAEELRGVARSLEERCNRIAEERDRLAAAADGFGGVSISDAYCWLHLRTHALVKIRETCTDSEASKIAGQILCVGVSDTAKLAHAANVALGISK